MIDRKAKIELYADKLKEWDSKLQKAEMKMNDVKDDMKSGAAKQIESLRNKLKDARRKLNNNGKDSGNSWSDIEKGIEENWKKIETSVKNVFSKTG
ncbi:MAG: hypothetical protein R6W68_06275 [Ignavibacteriaceae bacterium]